MHSDKYERKSAGSNLLGVIPLAAGVGGMKVVGDYSPQGFEHLWSTSELGYSGAAVVIGLCASLSLIFWGLAIIFGNR